jgi:ComF family protein
VQTLSKYDSFISDVIKLIKYRPSRKLLNLLVAQIESEDLLEKFKKKPHIFVPVPMHRKRLKVRGFNQAEVLAAGFAEMTGGHFSPVLIRNFATKAQASCVEEERLTNLDQAISLAKGVDKTAFIGKTIIIVDDVATTGTTLNTCKISLEKLKPRKIIGLVVSHSFKRVVRNDAVSKDNVTIWN